MIMFLLWIVISVAIAIAASRKGRNGAGWFFLSLIVSPLIAGIFLLAVGPKAVVVVQPQPVVDWTHVDWTGNSVIANEPSNQLTPVWVVVAWTLLGCAVFFGGLGLLFAS